MNNNLKTIIAPQINSSNYGQNVKDQFENINTNFQKLGNRDFVKGDSGESVSIIQVDINDESWRNEDGYSIKELIKNCLRERFSLLEGEKYDEIKALFSDKIGCDMESDIDELVEENIKSTDEDEDSEESTNITNKHGRYVYIIQIGSNVLGEGEIIGSLPFTYVDKRFHIANLKDLQERYSVLEDSVLGENSGLYDNAADLSCVMYVKNNKAEFSATETYPTLYFDEDQGQFCWKWHGQETGILASGPRGETGAASQVFIAYTDPSEADGSEYTLNEFLIKYGTGSTIKPNELINLYAPIDDVGNVEFEKLIGWPVIVMPKEGEKPQLGKFWVSTISDITKTKDENGYKITAICENSNCLVTEFNLDEFWQDIEGMHVNYLGVDDSGKSKDECKGYAIPAWPVDDDDPTEKPIHMLYADIKSVQDTNDPELYQAGHRKKLCLGYFQDKDKLSEQDQLKKYVSNNSLQPANINEDENNKDISFNVYYPTNIHYPMSIANTLSIRTNANVNNTSDLGTIITPGGITIKGDGSFKTTLSNRHLSTHQIYTDLLNPFDGNHSTLKIQNYDRFIFDFDKDSLKDQYFKIVKGQGGRGVQLLNITPYPPTPIGNEVVLAAGQTELNTSLTTSGSIINNGNRTTLGEDKGIHKYGEVFAKGENISINFCLVTQILNDNNTPYDDDMTFDVDANIFLYDSNWKNIMGVGVGLSDGVSLKYGDGKKVTSLTSSAGGYYKIFNITLTPRGKSTDIDLNKSLYIKVVPIINNLKSGYHLNTTSYIGDFHISYLTEEIIPISGSPVKVLTETLTDGNNTTIRWYNEDGSINSSNIKNIESISGVSYNCYPCNLTNNISLTDEINPNTEFGSNIPGENVSLVEVKGLDHVVNVFGGMTVYGKNLPPNYADPNATENNYYSLDVHQNIINSRENTVKIGSLANNKSKLEVQGELQVDKNSRFAIDGSDEKILINNEGLQIPYKTAGGNSGNIVPEQSYFEIQEANKGQILMADGELTTETPIKIKFGNDTETPFTYESRQFTLDLTYPYNKDNDIRFGTLANNKINTDTKPDTDNDIVKLGCIIQYVKFGPVVNCTLAIIENWVYFDPPGTLNIFNEKDVYEPTLTENSIQIPKPTLEQNLYIPIIIGDNIWGDNDSLKDFIAEDDVQLGYIIKIDTNNKITIKGATNWNCRHSAENPSEIITGNEGFSWARKISFTYICE